MRLHALVSTLTALLFAALAATAAYVAMTGDTRLVPFVLVVAFAHAVVLGWPAFLLGRSLGRVNLISSAILGFMIGACPIPLLTLVMPIGSNTSASIDGVPTMVNGIPTLIGLLYDLLYWSLFGGLGALGGILFFVIVKLAGGSVRPRSETPAPVSRRSSLATSGLAVVALLLTATAFAIPGITMDRTCHNMFRDGRTSVGTRVNVVLAVAVDDWPRVTQIFQDFAAAHHLSFRNSSHASPGVVDMLDLSLCNERGLNIHSLEQVWHQKNVSVPDKRGVSLGVYELRDGSDWRSEARELIARLEAVWPGRIQFKDNLGRDIPMPEELRSGSP